MRTQYFIAGIIQGSEKGLNIHDQSYRDSIRRILRTQDQHADVYCPVQNHPHSVTYDDRKAEAVFLDHLERVRRSHVLIVYLPSASMGSSIEMWEARQKNRLILSISPMSSNWIVRLLSDEVFENLDGFRLYVESGALREALHRRYPDPDTLTV